MTRIFLLLALVAGVTSAGAQPLRGKVFGEAGEGREILPGAVVHWLGTSVGAVANENGVFDLEACPTPDRRLVASMNGYVGDTINVGDRTYISITLRRDAKQLSSVTITDRGNATILSLDVAKTEVISKHELSKAACCDLAGCFGTQASVQPQTTNVITNAQELRILGLSGVYNQVLVDGLPLITGLSYTYGISTYPGSIVNNIYVSKGTTSVLQGYEAISGQINLDSKQPDHTDKLYLNAYMNSFGEKHGNANFSAKVGKGGKWTTLLALHSVQPSGRIDGNHDGFLDLPLLTRYMVSNKWKYGDAGKKGFSLQAGVRAVKETRVGGQNNFYRTADEGSATVYGQVVDYKQGEAFAKAAYRFNDGHVLAFSTSGLFHDQQSFFGTTRYIATQQSVYANLQHEWTWKKAHQLKYGISYRHQDLKEQISFSDTTLGRTYAGSYSTPLQVPGVFAENAFRWLNDKLTLLTGARADHHQVWGTYITPRAMLKYILHPQHTLRASAGRGWRQVNLFSEQVNLLVSSRDIVFVEPLKPEAAWNFGASHTYRFVLPATSGTISADVYGTQFSNQFFPDYDADPTKAYIRNFTGTSRSLGVQIDGALTFFRKLDVRAAYNYLDVYRVVGDVRQSLPFNPRNRAMGALSYRTESSKWQADMNVHWFDRMKLPDTRSNPAPYARGLYSVPYYTLNMQLTFRWKALDVYAGCENVFNYRQPNPIISADNPFGKYFDISSVWGPTRGREFYVGVRYAIK
ncbi:MAG: carboxypeptidase-like regulatory domain-containing protein [Flavipsychrobacter sp.]|nr:carboxypeptidase-like regulatory domain-containing protein [Flavipsychrobacter sp.]